MLISNAGRGNTFIQIPIRGVNNHQPVFDQPDVPVTFSVYEQIKNQLESNGIDLTATDADRCWYGAGKSSVLIYSLQYHIER